MNKHTYEEFLNTKVSSKDGTVTASLEDRNGEVYIVAPDFELRFRMLYKEEVHDILLIAAQHLIDIKLREDKIHADALATIEKMKTDQDQQESNEGECDNIGDQNYER